ncbi:TPA: hypothetical protein ACG0NJ_002168 [Clostridium perfringens]|jgi:hypothetical protein|uniref:hypothetical protein n=1 Tax=Clostridium perfringens TaxID=1502 RepID=UPI001A2F6264|nr:hypothetical protein [Clostridium perfringens]ELC8355011.1 hypothetical protein [Clostridium perfringens]MDM0731980.1 hypothetical protein [Clostridium perfringens]MDU4052284.1 hypothetical protein [Clostridium perfringens]UBK67553.1 hypothetical protein KLF46_14060 [Clostridium perfringens]HAT4233170.1 hypothetical protein [Clostridium perfringens]
MKISKTFSLEEDVLDKIVAYQKAKNLSSASAALERIILIELAKRDDIEKITENIKELFKNVKTTTLVEEEIIIDKNENDMINPNLDDSLAESSANMPD